MKKTFPPFLYLISVALFLLTDCAKATPTASPTPQPTETIIPTPTLVTMTGEDGATLVYVPEGEFTMGSDSGDSDEQPVHTVYLDAFWIDQTEVTNKMYTLYYGNSEFNNYPVNFVSWDDAVAYCSWAGRRLPTEAEWEKAARGTDARIYPWGNEAPSDTLLNSGSVVSNMTEVGEYPNGASPYGALDMAGNVWEWVNDWYSETYYQSSPSSNPLGPDSGDARVLRGGSVSGSYFNARSTSRGRGLPTSLLDDGSVGFRCARSFP